MLRPLRAGDFFTCEIPTADLYVLARIIHDWPEEKCLTLLKKIYDMCAPGQYTRYMWGFVECEICQVWESREVTASKADKLCSVCVKMRHFLTRVSGQLENSHCYYISYC